MQGAIKSSRVINCLKTELVSNIMETVFAALCLRSLFNE
jgi:hypothetical protein